MLNKQDAEYMAILSYGREKSFAGVVVPNTITTDTIKKNFQNGTYRYNTQTQCVEILKTKTKTETHCTESDTDPNKVSSMSDLAELSKSAKFETTKTVTKEWKTLISETAALQLIEAMHIDCKHGNRSVTMSRVDKSKFNRVGLCAMVNDYFAKGGKCSVCSKHKSHNGPEAVTSITSSLPFERLLADYTFPLGREDYCIATFIDHFTKRGWAFVSKHKTQINIINCLQWIMKSVNDLVPRIFQTDNGKEFGKKVEKWCEDHGIIVLHGKPYHPRTQGCIEKFNDTLCSEIFLQLDVNGLGVSDWQSLVTTAVEIYNNRKHETIKMTPMEAWNGCVVYSFEDKSKHQLEETITIYHNIQTNMEKRANYDMKRRNASVVKFQVGDVVWVNTLKLGKDTKRNVDTIPQNNRRLAEIQAFSGNYSYRIKWLSSTGYLKEKQGTFHRYYVKSNVFSKVDQADYYSDIVEKEVGGPLSEHLGKAAVEAVPTPKLPFVPNDKVYLISEGAKVGVGHYVGYNESLGKAEVKVGFVLVEGTELDEYPIGSVAFWSLDDLVRCNPIHKAPKPNFSIPMISCGEAEPPREWDDDEVDDSAHSASVQPEQPIVQPEASSSLQSMEEEEVLVVPVRSRRVPKRKRVSESANSAIEGTKESE